MIMTLFVPSSAAEPLSAALWQIARPAGARRPRLTTRLFPWVTDTGGGRWLVVETEFSIPVHGEAGLGSIADILQPWVGHGLEQAEIDALAGVVESHRGGRMTPWAFFPQVFKDLSKTHAEMIDAGLLAEAEGGGA